MANDGRALEQLVAELEKLLLGTGFNVTPNQKVFDEEGNQIAEFDVQIEGHVGSTSFKWLIECRDRPSEGPAPSSWIQHLAGRKQLFQFDKVIAVSTTGFSPAAKQAAETLNISLRGVANVEQISQEFGTIEFRLRALKVSVQDFGDYDFPGSARDEVLQLGSAIAEPEIRYVCEPDFLTLHQFILRELLQNPNVKEPASDQSKMYTYEQHGDMELRVGRRLLPLRGLIAPITAHYSYHPTTALSVKSYAEDGRVIGEEVALSTETDAEIVRTTVLVTKRNGDVLVVQNTSHEVIRK